MKRIGILSDTHSCWDERFATHFAGCDEIWHAGDVGDIEVIRRLEETAPIVRAVYGNIDHGEVCRRCRETEIFEIEGIRVWMTHIGGYPGRYSSGVKQSLRLNKPNLMISGHSHILKVMWDQELNLLHINPGAAGYHGWQKERTLIRLTINNGNMHDLEVIELGKKTIDKQQ